MRREALHLLLHEVAVGHGVADGDDPPPLRAQDARHAPRRLALAGCPCAPRRPTPRAPSPSACWRSARSAGSRRRRRARARPCASRSRARRRCRRRPPGRPSSSRMSRGRSDSGWMGMPVGVERARQLRRVAAAVDVRDLGRGEGHDPARGVLAEDGVEVVEVAAGGSHDDDPGGHEGSFRPPGIIRGRFGGRQRASVIHEAHPCSNGPDARRGDRARGRRGPAHGRPEGPAAARRGDVPLPRLPPLRAAGDRRRRRGARGRGGAGARRGRDPGGGDGRGQRALARGHADVGLGGARRRRGARRRGGPRSTRSTTRSSRPPRSTPSSPRSAEGAEIAVPSHAGRRGHPAGFARSSWPALRAAPLDGGARTVLAAQPDRVVHVPARGRLPRGPRHAGRPRGGEPGSDSRPPLGYDGWLP